MTDPELAALERLAKAAETLRYGRDMVTWIRESNVPEAYIMAASPDVVLGLIAAAHHPDVAGLREALLRMVNETYETHHTPSSESGPEEWDYTLSEPTVDAVEQALRVLAHFAAANPTPEPAPPTWRCRSCDLVQSEVERHCVRCGTGALREALVAAHRPHRPDCAQDRYPGSFDQPLDPCTCGLDELMERTASEPDTSQGDAEGHPAEASHNAGPGTQYVRRAALVDPDPLRPPEPPLDELASAWRSCLVRAGLLALALILVGLAAAQLARAT